MRPSARDVSNYEQDKYLAENPVLGRRPRALPILPRYLVEVFEERGARYLAPAVAYAGGACSSCSESK